MSQFLIRVHFVGSPTGCFGTVRRERFIFLSNTILVSCTEMRSQIGRLFSPGNLLQLVLIFCSGNTLGPSLYPPVDRWGVWLLGLFLGLGDWCEWFTWSDLTFEPAPAAIRGFVQLPFSNIISFRLASFVCKCIFICEGGHIIRCVNLPLIAEHLEIVMDTPLKLLH